MRIIQKPPSAFGDGRFVPKHFVTEKKKEKKNGFDLFVCRLNCYSSRSVKRKMSYNLRSSNRLRNIQFKAAQQNEYIFRSSLSDCKRTRRDDFGQREFLSLFELVPCSNSNQIEIRFIETPDYREYHKKKRPLNPKNTKLCYSVEENNNVAYFDQGSRRLVLGKHAKSITPLCATFSFFFFADNFFLVTF